MPVRCTHLLYIRYDCADANANASLPFLPAATRMRTTADDRLATLIRPLRNTASDRCPWPCHDISSHLISSRSVRANDRAECVRSEQAHDRLLPSLKTAKNVASGCGSVARRPCELAVFFSLPSNFSSVRSRKGSVGDVRRLHPSPACHTGSGSRFYSALERLGAILPTIGKDPGLLSSHLIASYRIVSGCRPCP